MPLNIEKSRLSAIPKAVKASQLVSENDVLLEYYQNFSGADFSLPEYGYHWFLIQDVQGPSSFFVESDGNEKDLSGNLNAKSVIYIPSFRKTSWQFSHGQGCMHILFPDRIIFEVMDHWNIPPFLIDDLYACLGSNILSVAEPLGIIMNEIKAHGNCSPILFEEFLYIAVTKMLANQFSLGSEGKHKKLKIAEKGKLLSESQLQLLREYVWSQYQNKIYLKDLASLLNMSPYYFCRVFHKTTQFTPTQFVQRLRISALRNLLSFNVFRRKQLNLAALSLDAGFYDQPHMTKTFRRWVGVSPMEYVQAIG